MTSRKVDVVGPAVIGTCLEKLLRSGQGIGEATFGQVEIGGELGDVCREAAVAFVRSPLLRSDAEEHAQTARVIITRSDNEGTKRQFRWLMVVFSNRKAPPSGGEV